MTEKELLMKKLRKRKPFKVYSKVTGEEYAISFSEHIICSRFPNNPITMDCEDIIEYVNPMGLKFKEDLFNEDK